jgi:CheY-like chemotaxis protein
MKAKILVVEDEVFTALWITDHLRQLDYDVGEPAATGAEAVQRAQAENPDFILMDIRLVGEMDGIEAAQKILAQRPTLIAFMTGYSDPKVKARAARLNPVAYLQKPFLMKDLDNLLATALPDA